jgi:alkanesulfonate monooxygenase SsuD/methylene tetrahydromethanopterin reductase-like flavin-dependent oxidoreductase (luciferase family)
MCSIDRAAAEFCVSQSASASATFGTAGDLRRDLGRYGGAFGKRVGICPNHAQLGSRFKARREIEAPSAFSGRPAGAPICPMARQRHLDASWHLAPIAIKWAGENPRGHAMPSPLPAVSLVAVPSRRRRTIELAQEIERRGFAGIWAPSIYGNMSLCEAVAWNTTHIKFGTAIAPIYQRSVLDFAQSAAFLHEVSGGRFHLGIGIAHAPSYVRLGVTPGKPLSDTRNFVDKLRAERDLGAMPPVILAALRARMVALAGEIGQGVVFANAARSHMAASLAALPEEKRTATDFFIGNMLPTCITDDIDAAKAVLRRALTSYAFRPNYRNYWKEAGYVEEMADIERAIDAGRNDDVPNYLTDRWLADCTLFGPAHKIRDGMEAWRDAGVHTPIIVPSSAAGGQLKAFEEIFATFV